MNVGAYAITQGTLALSSNYALTYVGANLTVNPASLTITANNATKAAGQVNPTFTASYSGFVNGDTSASLTTAADAQYDGHNVQSCGELSRHSLRSGRRQLHHHLRGRYANR